MKDYIKQLENENEELRLALAKSQDIQNSVCSDVLRLIARCSNQLDSDASWLKAIEYCIHDESDRERHFILIKIAKELSMICDSAFIGYNIMLRIGESNEKVEAVKKFLTDTRSA